MIENETLVRFFVWISNNNKEKTCTVLDNPDNPVENILVDHFGPYYAILFLVPFRYRDSIIFRISVLEKPIKIHILFCTGGIIDEMDSHCVDFLCNNDHPNRGLRNHLLFGYLFYFPFIFMIHYLMIIKNNGFILGIIIITDHYNISNILENQNIYFLKLIIFLFNGSKI